MSALVQPPCPCGHVYKFRKIRSFVHQNLRTFATENPLLLVRKVSALDKPPSPLSADVFYGRPLNKLLGISELSVQPYILLVHIQKHRLTAATSYEFYLGAKPGLY